MNMRWFWNTFDSFDDVTEFLNKHNLAPEQVVVMRSGYDRIVVFYYADCELA